MPGDPTRRQLMRTAAAMAAGGGALSAFAGTAAAGRNYPNSDKDAIVSAPTDDGAVLASVNRYPSYGDEEWQGALIEEVVAGRYDAEHLYDHHVMLWDGTERETLDVRNDATSSEVSYASPRVPEVRIHNEFEFDAGHGATLDQDVLVTPDRQALLIRNAAEFDRANEHTLYSLSNPEIDDGETPGAGDEGYVTSHRGYQSVVVTSGARYLAFAQRRPATGKTTFDGHRIGIETEASGPDRAAWYDVYEENDGFVSSNRANEGDLDVGTGLYVGTDRSVTWMTAVGFGTSEREALDNAVAPLEVGYDGVRARFEQSWRDWHDSLEDPWGAGDDGCGSTDSWTANGSLSGTGDEATHAYEPQSDDPCSMTVHLDGSAGDFDLYLTFDGRTPSPFDHDRKAWTFGSEETIEVEDAGRVDELGILVRSYLGGGEYSLTVEETGESGARDAPDVGRKMYRRSLTSLKCAQDPRGPMIAGIFEPHGDQYTYVWPRDQVVMIQSLLASGATEEAKAALSWLDDAQITTSTPNEKPSDFDRKGTWWQNYELDGSRNWYLLQLDQVGGPIYAHWLTWRETGDRSVLEDHYEMSRLAAEFLLRYDNGYGFPKMHNDPWEEVWGYSTEGVASGIAGLRAMAEMADERGDGEFAANCRDRADTWASNFETYLFKPDGMLGEHYVTADKARWEKAARKRPDAAAFMAYWPWNVRAADREEMLKTVRKADDDRWKADEAPCLGRYPNDDYTPSGSAEDGGWPLAEAYADVVRWQGGVDESAVEDYLFDHAPGWTTAAGLLPERVDGAGDVRWNSNLQWSQATYLLLSRSHADGEPFGLAPEE